MAYRFATTLTCIDGRVQRPLNEWAAQHLGVDYLDTITEPGPDAAVLQADDAAFAALLAKIRVSLDAHGSTALIVASHGDCAGNPVDDPAHHDQVRAAVARLAEHLPALRISGVHLSQCGDDVWEPSVVCETGAADRPAEVPALRG